MHVMPLPGRKLAMFAHLMCAVLLSFTILQAAALPISTAPQVTSSAPWWARLLLSAAGPLSVPYSRSFDKLSYADVVKIGAHDSMAIGTRIVDNQHLTVTQQLDFGIRLLQAQGHPWDSPSTRNPSGISLCHTSCYLQNGGFLEDWLREILAWMDKHPTEIVTILLTNPEGASIDDWAAGFESLSVYDRAYEPPMPDISRKDWPTYGQMRAANQTLVIFMDRGTSFSKYPYIINEFGNVWENRYDQTTLPFNCSVDRSSRPRDRLGLINHFLNDEVVGVGIQYPNKEHLDGVNAAMGDFRVLSGFKNCTEQHGGTRPTFVLVNFSDKPAVNGPVLAGDVLNNVTSADAVTAAASTSAANRAWLSRIGMIYAVLGATLMTLMM